MIPSSIKLLKTKNFMLEVRSRSEYLAHLLPSCLVGIFMVFKNLAMALVLKPSLYMCLMVAMVLAHLCGTWIAL